MEISKQAKVGQLLAEESNAGTIALRYGLEDKPSPIEAILYGAQHVLIMFSAMVASPLVIGQLLNLPAELRAALITGVMLGCGIGTLISALGVGGVGARLPLLLGAYTVYIGPVVQIARTESLGAATGALLIGAIVLLAVSPLVGKVRSFFPPIVIGSLLIVTGLALIKIAMNVAFGANTPYFGNPITVAFLLGSIILITIIAALGNRTVRSFSILLAVIGVYIAGFFSGLDNFENLVAAPWFRIPSLLPYGIAWPSVGGATSIIIYQVVAAIYTMSITIALCVMIQVEPTEPRIRGAIAGDGLGSMIAVIFRGSSPDILRPERRCDFADRCGQSLCCCGIRVDTCLHGFPAKGGSRGRCDPTLHAWGNAGFHVRHDCRGRHQDRLPIPGRTARYAHTRSFGRPQHGCKFGTSAGVRSRSGSDPHIGRRRNCRRRSRRRLAEHAAALRKSELKRSRRLRYQMRAPVL
jgi:Permease family